MSEPNPNSPADERLRILVLTSSTGGGHDARAEAFAEWCFQLYRHQVDVRIEQMLEKSSVVNRSGVSLYNRIQRGAPWMHKIFYAVVEVLSYLNRSDVTFGASYYAEVVRTYRPHLIFSVHDCLNRGYFQLARRLLGVDRVRCATYCGEFSGGWGYSRNWIEPSVDRYFSRTRTANDYAVKKGLPADRSRVRGTLMLPRSHLEILAAAERRQYRMRQLGLDPDRFTFFLATGGNGANNHFDLLPALLRHASRAQAIIICGRNKQTYNELVHWRAVHECDEVDIYAISWLPGQTTGFHDHCESSFGVTCVRGAIYEDRPWNGPDGRQTVRLDVGGTTGGGPGVMHVIRFRSEEHTSELQSH